MASRDGSLCRLYCACREAHAIYISAVQQALNERDSAWQTAIATGRSLTEEAYAEYQRPGNQAAQADSTTVEEADAIYQEAALPLTTLLHATLHQIWTEYMQRVEGHYQADLAAANAAFNEYSAPYQAARDQAYEYWQEHLNDADAYAAYQQTQRDLDGTIAYANDVRD